MPTWNPAQYLKFADQRTQPCRDLAAHIALSTPRSLIDLGCGPGNSTDVLATRWPDADIIGIDNSPDMIETARHDYPEHEWILQDITDWAAEQGERYDIVFANAALQWIPNHETLYPQLFARVAPGGALAVQIPSNWGAPAHRVMREVATSPAWRDRFPQNGVREWHAHDVTFYYDTLSPHTDRIDLWETEYLHIMENVEAIEEWYRGTGLRPFLDALSNDQERARFTQDYRDALSKAYPAQANGRVLFPFRRMFLVAYQPEAPSALV